MATTFNAVFFYVSEIKKIKRNLIALFRLQYGHYLQRGSNPRPQAYTMDRLTLLRAVELNVDMMMHSRQIVEKPLYLRGLRSTN